MNTHLNRAMMWSLGSLVVTGCFILIWHLVISVELDKQFLRNSPEIVHAEVTTRLGNIYWFAWGGRLFFGGSALIVLIGGGGFVYAKVKQTKAKARRESTYVYKIGEYNEITVDEKDLSLAAPIAMGLMNAEQLKQMNGGVEKALQLYERMADVQSKQIQSLVGRKGIPLTSSQPALPAQEISHTEPIPTFQQLLTTGDIARGKPMILGYENGVPRRGSFLDIYSAAVAGESGSGKTATLLFLIGSGLIAQRIKFLGIDPHYPHPKSLGFKTKPLWEAGLMSMATYKDDMLTVLNQVEQTIDRRLQQIETDETPVVLVIDELAFLAKTSIGSAIAHTMERISMEGRKCAVYMLASSQTWLSSRTGNSSVVRDTLTSAYVHRIKPKQANLLLQDKDEADKVKKQVKHAGEALLVPVGNESVIVTMPFTTAADMRMVVEMAGQQQNVSQRSVQDEKITYFPSGTSLSINEEFEQIVAGVEPAALPEVGAGTIFHADLSTEYALRVRAKALLKESTISYGDIKRETGIAQSTAHNWINHPEKQLKPEQKTALRNYLERLEQSANSTAETGLNDIHKCAVNA